MATEDGCGGSCSTLSLDSEEEEDIEVKGIVEKISLLSDEIFLLSEEISLLSLTTLFFFDRREPLHFYFRPRPL